MDEELIKARKTILGWMNEARKESKNEKCKYCGNRVASFCKSHSIPEFILKKITQDGWIYSSNLYFEQPILDTEKGINNSGTFHNICRECDSKIFQDYESEERLKNEISNKMMAEIALKNILQEHYTKKVNIKILEMRKAKAPMARENIIMETAEKTHITPLKIDVKELEKDFKIVKKIIDKNLKSGFKLIFSHQLNYVAPIAFQGQICLFSDLEGNIINDMYNMDERTQMQYIHLAVFPLENTTRVLLFFHKNNNRYFKFEKQFNRLSLEEKLQLIAFTIFLQSENFYLSKQIDEEIKNNEGIKNIAKITGELYNITEEMKRKRAELMQMFPIVPNVLSEKYKIK